ncbi:striatin-3 isoform X2 [Notolabrus celidotus]|uniref:striatin-3 isoform X2 n=1 Tax=Notolabrus celidotus TaxID=1203425 RepID=UPI00148F7683|nr:striatin-3 isoform X2 [Notolabrus celidotus]
MEEQPGGGGGGGAGGAGTQRQQQQGGNQNQNQATGGVMVPHQPDELPRPQQQYTIPGILHYIQHEWARFEMERAHWEVERAELQPLVPAVGNVPTSWGLSLQLKSTFSCRCKQGRVLRKFLQVDLLLLLYSSNPVLRPSCSPGSFIS